MFPRLLEVSGSDEEFGHLNASRIVSGFEIDGSCKFVIGTRPLLGLEISEGKPVMGGDVLGIERDGVVELDGGLGKLSFFEIALAAFEIFLFANIRITRACGKRADESQNQRKTENENDSQCGISLSRNGYSVRSITKLQGI